MKLQTKETPAGSQAPVPGGVYTLINVPLVIIGTLLLVVAFVPLLSTVPMGVTLAVAAFLGMVAIVGVVMFVKARNEQHRPQSQYRERTTPASNKVSPSSVPSQIIEAQVTSQPRPPPVAVPQSVPQGEWTPECDTALAALVSRRIPKRKAIDLVRRAAGATHDEILRNALKIHGQNRTQMPQSVNGHAVGANTPTQVTPASPSVQNQSPQVEAIAALVELGIQNRGLLYSSSALRARPRTWFGRRYKLFAEPNDGPHNFKPCRLPHRPVLSPKQVWNGSSSNHPSRADQNLMTSATGASMVV
jgi:hypothetical protein